MRSSSSGSIEGRPPTWNGRGDVVRVKPLVDFLPGRLGEGGLHPAHDLVHDLGVDVLEVLLRKTV